MQGKTATSFLILTFLILNFLIRIFQSGFFNPDIFNPGNSTPIFYPVSIRNLRLTLNLTLKLTLSLTLEKSGLKRCLPVKLPPNHDDSKRNFFYNIKFLVFADKNNGTM